MAHNNAERFKHYATRIAQIQNRYFGKLFLICNNQDKSKFSNKKYNYAEDI